MEAMRDIDLRGCDPARVELIVIDNNPNPATRDFCEQAGHSLPIHVHYATEAEPGITYARNRAVAVALERGADFIAFIDDDDVPRPDWLRHLLQRQAATGADLVFGSWVLDEDMPEWARKSGLFRSLDKSKRGKNGGRYGLPDCASTCNVLVSRAILQRVAAAGPVFSHDFRESGGEDKDFFIRAQAMGASLASAEQSIIHRIHGPERYTARGLVRRGFKNGCSQVSMARYHGDTWRLLRLFLAALVKSSISLILLPFTIFSRGLFTHGVYRIAKGMGVMYSTLTGRSIKYYSR